MRKADLLQIWSAALVLICLLASCSSSSSDTAIRLNGEWDCKIRDNYAVLRIKVENGTVKLSERDATIEAQIVKVDGPDIYLSSPVEKEHGRIRFADDNTFTLQDAGNPDRPVYACRRKN